MGQKLGDVGIGPFDFSGVGTKQDLARLSSEGNFLVRQEFAQGRLDRRWLDISDMWHGRTLSAHVTEEPGLHLNAISAQ